MADASDSICFYCSQAFTLDGRLNRTEDGRPCPICAERLLEALPPLVPVDPESEAQREGATGGLRPRALGPEVDGRDRPEPA